MEETDGKVSLKSLMEYVKYIKENVDISKLENYLKNMGITVTEDELQDLKKNLPIDALGKINKKNLMNALQNLSKGKLNINDLDKVLKYLGIKLTDREMEELLSYLHTDATGKVSLKTVMDNMKSIKENIVAQNLKNFLMNMGIILTEDEHRRLLKNLPIDAKGKIKKKNIINAVKTIPRGKLNINDLDKVLENLGIKLTDREMEELLSNLTINADGKVFLKNVMDNVKFIKENIDAQNLENFMMEMGITLTENELQCLLKALPIDDKGKINKKNIKNVLKSVPVGKVNINDLDKVLENLGIKLTEGEMEDLSNDLLIDTDGKVSLKNVMETMKSIKENINSQNLENFLKNMGITLTEEEHQHLLKFLPIDANGKINKKNIMNTVKKLDVGNVDIHVLDKLLENLGIKVTAREMEKLLSDLPVYADGKVSLKKVMESMKSIKENIDAQDLETFLKDMGIILAEYEFRYLKRHLPIDAKGKINKKNIINTVKKLPGGKIKLNNLDKILEILGIELADREMEELLSDLPINADGRVSLKNIIDKVKSIKESIDAQNLENFLKDMGITFTEEELQDFLKRLPIDVKGKINKKNIMNALKTLSGENITINDLDEGLGNLGIKTANKETDELLAKTFTDATGKIPLNKLLDNMKYVRGE
ncbi:EF-hand calcium-binding domain-containing protein 13-like [Macrotis lagotis]|uniref:EF-hand calcium-binding domain-containing protein 13-like n=1 Tax=Macrotis lagotis TaxID=92651 RepID=UPI003D69AC30